MAVEEAAFLPAVERDRMLKTIERALARQCLAIRAQHMAQLPGQCRGGRILAQFVVTVESS
jgi:hypothetical protein